MKKAPIVKEPLNPALLDEAFIGINGKLVEYLPWLTNAFGKAQKLSRLNDQKKIIKYPAVYTGEGKEYASMLPDEGYGNFSYWDVEDYKIDWISRQNQIVTAKVGFVVWMNLNKTLAANERRNLESIKEEVLKFFSFMSMMRVRLSFGSITEEHDKIYKGYSTKEIKSQYLMHPFAGLRFDGEIRYERWCNDGVVQIGGINIGYTPTLNLETYLQDWRAEYDAFKDDAYDDGISVDGGIIM